MRKALLVGAGGMGRAWARNLTSAGVDIVAWVDVRAGAASAAAVELDLPRTHTELSFAEALSVPGIDFVVDVTAPEAHCGITVAALGAGLPVIGEKPMATSLDEARRMVSAADAAGKLFMVSQSRRYDAHIAAYRDLIIRHIGPLAILNADFYRGPHFGGFRDEMESPLLLDMAIHTFDQARFISRADPISVYAEEFNPPWSWFQGDACASAGFEMSDGLRFNYRGSWCTQGMDTSWQAEWRACGARGAALWDGDHAPAGEIVDEHGGTQPIDCTVPDLKSGIAGSLEEFLSALDTGSTPSGECHDNIKSLAMVFAATRSARSGVREVCDS
ncbi:MAG: Gfo/Idh/MocA family protein [Fimbriimonadaceae bacterium]